MTYDQTEGGDPTYMPTFQTQSSWFTAYRLYSPPGNPYGRCWAVQVDRSSRLKSYGKDSSHCRADSRNDSQEDWGMREGNHAVAVTVEVGEVESGDQAKVRGNVAVLNAPSLLSFISQLWSILVST